MIKPNYPYSKDNEFIRQISEENVREQKCKISILSWNEEIIQTIEGFTSNGNINLNGDSPVRRTGNLTLLVDGLDYDFDSLKNLISINKKIFIEIGLKNITDKYTDYDTIWMPLGLFIMIAPSISHDVNGIQISMQIKDKMCLLDGTIAGTIPAAVTLSEKEDFDENGKTIINYPTIFQIIQEVVNHLGGESLVNIIIADVPNRVRQVMKWSGTKQVYLTKIQEKEYKLESAYDDKALSYSNGYDVGYTYTDFIFPGELIAKAGDSVCSILNKIKDTLGNFEYYYDVYGHFIFQEIKNYLNTTYTKTILNKIENNDYLVDFSKTKSVYEFNKNGLPIRISSSPKYSQIKNDFVIWGERTGIDGIKYPIRYHLAIDDKPELQSHEARKIINELGEVVYIKDKKTENNSVIQSADWRTELYLQGVESVALARDTSYYFTELSSEWTNQYDIENQTFKREYLDRPETLNFYLEIIDSNSALGDLSVKNIGRRTKVLNDNTINCLFEPEIPDIIIMCEKQEDYQDRYTEAINNGENICKVSEEVYDNITIGGHFNSAFNAMKDLLYQYTNYNENISISAIPLYFLEPNTRITVTDTESGINGDYTIKTISLPLGVNETMSISANKALTKI